MNTSQSSIVKIPEVFLAEIRAAIIQTGKVKVTGLGIFETRRIAGHPGRHPVTGQIVDFPPHTRIKFRPTSSLYRDAQKPADAPA